MVELIVGEDLFPGRHTLGRPPLMHGGPEFLAHIVTVAMTQQPQVDLPLALDRVRTVAVRTGSVEYLLARTDGLGAGRVALGLGGDHTGGLRRAGPGPDGRSRRHRWGRTEASRLAGRQAIFDRERADRGLKLRQDGIDAITQLGGCLRKADRRIP